MKKLKDYHRKIKGERLKMENKLIEELKEAEKRIENGEYETEDEFFKEKD